MLRLLAMIFITALLGALCLLAVRRFLPSRWRMAGSWLAALLPLLAFLALALAEGCIPIPPGERCYWFGMGLVVLSPAFLSWTSGAAIAALASRRRKPDPESQ